MHSQDRHHPGQGYLVGVNAAEKEASRPLLLWSPSEIEEQQEGGRGRNQKPPSTRPNRRDRHSLLVRARDTTGIPGRVGAHPLRFKNGRRTG